MGFIADAGRKFKLKSLVNFENNIMKKVATLDKWMQQHKPMSKITNAIDAVGGAGFTNKTLGGIHGGLAVGHAMGLARGYGRRK